MGKEPNSIAKLNGIPKLIEKKESENWTQRPDRHKKDNRVRKFRGPEISQLRTGGGCRQP